MKISYDPEVDALSIIFRSAECLTRELEEGIALDIDEEGRVAGIEVLDFVHRFGDHATLRQVVLEGMGPAMSSPSGTANA